MIPTPPKTYSQLLNGGNNSQVGVGKSFKVYPGDKVKIEAYAKYYTANSGTANLTGFATALLSAFGLTPPGGSETGTAASALNSYGTVVANGSGQGTNTYPKAFVNILLFDKNYNFLDIAYEQIDGGQQVGLTPKAPHDYMNREYTVKEVGYAYVYLSNENPTFTEVYFDDVTITHTPTNVIQYNEYYPFGLQTSASWTREKSKNDYLYNEGSELNKTSGWYELPYRNYDPAIGRFTGVDPMATMYASYSGYHYSYNSPVMFNDPSGAVTGDQDVNGDGRIDCWEAGNCGSGESANNWMTSGYAGDIAQSNGPQPVFNNPASFISYALNFSPHGGSWNSSGSSTFYTSSQHGHWEESTAMAASGAGPTKNGFELPTFTKTSKWVWDDNQTGCPTCLDPSTVGNWFYIYGGPNNPKSNNGDYNYDLAPKNISDKQAYIHDKDYDEKDAVGGLDLGLNFSAIQADMKFVKNQLAITGLYATQFLPAGTPTIDPITNKPISFGTAVNALIQGVGLGIITAPKILIHGFLTTPPPLIGK